MTKKQTEKKSPEDIDPIKVGSDKVPQLEYTKDHLQLARRAFHFFGGTLLAYLYAEFFNHASAIHLIGILTCVVFIFEHARKVYPEYNEIFNKLARPFLRAEEHMRESAMIPFFTGVLLTILSYPKTIAISAIIVLAWGDPLSAIVGILFGKTKNKHGKSLQGSLAFFFSIVLAVALTFYILVPSITPGKLTLFTLANATILTFLERIPNRIDDNFLIPVVSGFILWILSPLFGIPLN